MVDVFVFYDYLCEKSVISHSLFDEGRNDSNDVKLTTKYIQPKMKRLFTISILMMVALVSLAAIYEPTLSSDSEVCVFFEANS